MNAECGMMNYGGGSDGGSEAPCEVFIAFHGVKGGYLKADMPKN